MSLFFTAGCDREKETVTIVALGDSTTAGTPGFFSPREKPPEGQGDPESQYAHWMMQAHPEWNVLNRGVRAERSEQIRARFDTDVKNENAQVLVVIAGVNDVFQGYSESHVKENLSGLYRQAEDAGIRVMACTILPFNLATPAQNEKIRNLNQWIRQTAQENGYGFCDTFSAVENPQRPGQLRSTYDQIHPDAQGYRMMAETITRALEKWL